MDYKDFAKRAHSHYINLPDETSELYIKNSIKLVYPDEIVPGKPVADFATGVEKELDSKFDIKITNAGAESSSGFAKVFSAEELPEELLAGKITDGSEDKISAYINANSGKIVCIEVPEGREARLSILVASSAHLPFQVLVNYNEGSRLNLFEYYCSAEGDGGYAAPLHEIRMDKDSSAEFSLINNKAEGSMMMGFTKAVLSEGSSLRATHVYSGSSVTKMKCVFDAAEEGSRVEAREIVLGAKEQRFDLNTFIMNSKPHTYAKLESGAVLDGSSLCMLKGYAKVEKFAKGAVSRVEEHGILLSESAHIDALPDMAIDYSDGVSATHSAATAPIDKDALFYLMSRGIGSLEGRRLFVGAFMSKYLSGISNPLVRELATSLLLSKAGNGLFGKLPKISMKDVWSAN